MFINYIKTALRSLSRGKKFTLINICGLALGMTVFLLITEYVASEWRANRDNANYARLYRTNVLEKEGSSSYHLPPGYAPMIQARFPNVAAIARTAENIGAGAITFAINTLESKTFKESNISYVDSNFLELFTFPLIAGKKNLPANTLAISEQISEKFFGNNNAVGQTLAISNQFGTTSYIIGAVYQQPNTSDIKAEVLLSFQTLSNAANRDGNDWADPATTDNGFTSIYLLLAPNTDAGKLAANITSFVKSINPDSKNDQVYLQPFSELHLAPSFDYPYQTYGNLLLVVVFGSIALLILFIAWLNYINLSTAQALTRAKDTGVRKVLGASRQQLIGLHLVETAILTTVSMAVAMIMVSVLQPLFNNFTGQDLSLNVLNSGYFWLACISVILTGSLLSGTYIAWILTSFKPITTIRSRSGIFISGLPVRKALVVFQFAASIVFIIATTVLYNQLQFMKNGQLGMKLEQLLVIPGPTIATERQAETNVAFKNSLAQLPFISKVAGSNNIPGVGYNFQANGIGRSEASEAEKKPSFQMFICDQNFFDTYGIRFQQGKSFSPDDAERSWNNVHKMIINEKAARQLGYDPATDLIGKKISWGKTFEIIGVVKDYHHTSLRENIEPTIYLGSVAFSYFTVAIDSRNLDQKLATLKTLYTKSFPGNPFEYFFADEQFNKQYDREQQLGKVFVAAALVAIFIACLGLYGLAAFSAKQRTKEIGIRKVLGASIAGITALISKDFLKLVIIAFFIASPIAWWVMHQWLQNFAYRIIIGPGILIGSGLVALVIALTTISFQSIKAAIANPTKSLRSE